MSISSDEANAKRQRVSRACDQCRKKKIKCDGLSPICSNCQIFQLECTFKDTTKKRGPPKGYIEAIENRLQKLEKYLNNMAKNNRDDPETIELMKELQSPLATSSGETINGRPQRRRRKRQQQQQQKEDENTMVDSPMSPLIDSPPLEQLELQEDINDTTGSLSIDEHGQVRYLGNSSGFYLLSDSRTYKNGVFHFTGYYHRLKEQKLNNLLTNSKKFTVNPLELPDQDVSKELVDLFFDHLYPVLPIFYKRQIVSNEDSLDNVSPLLLNAIYAIASRMSSNIKVRSDPSAPDTAGDIFYERARCLLDDYYDTPKISTVQALLLLASHQMGAMKPAKAWLYSGMAFRMAQDLGLNRNCDHWKNIAPEERERRKRVFWCCFIVDRLMCAIYGRSANFDERDCDVPFPSVDDDEPITCKDPSRPPVRLLDVFIQSIKLAYILGHVLKSIYYVKSKHRTDSQQIDRILNTLHKQLTQWHSNLSPALQYQLPNTQNGEKSRDPPSAICQLHLMYYTIIILLHRSFIPGPKQTQLPISLPSYKICETAATSVMDIVNIMLGENHLRYVYNFSVFYVFTAGIIFIKLASSSTDPNRAFDAKINTNRIMAALDNLEFTWMNASRCCNILGELAGLRDIRLEVDKYVPKKVEKPSPPPSIAVPNFSPEFGPTKTDNNQDVVDMQLDKTNLFNTSSFPVSSVRQSSNFVNMVIDPFIQPDTQTNTTFDPIDSAFWGIPTSLNTDEWNDYFGTLQHQQKPPASSLNNNKPASVASISSVEISNSPSQSILFNYNKPDDPQPSTKNDTLFF